MIQPKRRNPLVLHAWMKQGGRYNKLSKAERQALQQATRQWVAQARVRD
jgi:hypothetical protein